MREASERAGVPFESAAPESLRIDGNQRREEDEERCGLSEEEGGSR